MPPKLYCYNGIIHVHSLYSDGEKSIPEIASIANELDIDFLLMTDHNTLQPKYDGHEGWHNQVLVGVGSELNDADDKNHYLALNIKKDVNHKVPAETYVRNVREQGGFGIIAHPDETRTNIPAYPPYPWTLWDSEDFDGIEIWNQMSEWMEGLTHLNKIWRAMHPRRSIVSPKKQTLARWDQLNMKRKVVGVGGVDAHGYIHRLLGLFSVRIFRYKISFRTIRTHILTKQPLSKEDSAQALKMTYEAIHNANCFVSHRYIGDADSFRFWAENEQSSATMGETLALSSETYLRIINPQEAATRIIHNGQVLEESTGTNLEFKVSRPGIYRAEIHKSGKAWIFSNHIRLEHA